LGYEPESNVQLIVDSLRFLILPSTFPPALPEMFRFCLHHAENHAVGMFFTEDIHTLRDETFLLCIQFSRGRILHFLLFGLSYMITRISLGNRLISANLSVKDICFSYMLIPTLGGA